MFLYCDIDSFIKVGVSHSGFTHYRFNRFRIIAVNYSVLVSVSCPKAVYHLESDNLFRITVVVADWLG